MPQAPIKYLFYLILLVSTNLKSQDPIFAFAYDPNGKVDPISINESHNNYYKYEVTFKILNELVDAKGVFNMPSPDLILSKNEQKPAWINLKESKIYLEEKAYDICTELGQDSLAALSILLSHELVHYYENHDWTNHFIQHYGQNLKDSKSEIYEDQIKLEIQADQLGQFLSNIAGYNTSGVHGPLLEKIYKDYNLNTSTTQSYPSLEERKKIAESGEKLMLEMSHAFDMSVYLTLIGHYQKANDYLNHILQNSKFQSREIYNNQGVLLALSSLLYFSEQEMPFIIPLELEVNSRLSRKSIDKSKRNLLLEKAEKALAAAIQLDEDYISAFVNLASVRILQQDYFEAEYLCNKLLKKHSKQLTSLHKSNLYINLGILNHLNQNKEEAKALFEKAKANHNNDIVSFNISVLEDKKLPFEKSEGRHIQIKSEGTELNQLMAKINLGEIQAQEQIEIDKETSFFYTNDNNQQLYMQLKDWGDAGFSFFKAINSIQLNNEELKDGQSQQAVVDILGKPNISIGNINGESSYYDDLNLIVDFDKDKKVRKFIFSHTNN